MPDRLVPRPTFLSAERRPLIYFATTSEDKRLQARFVFSKYGFDLRAFMDVPEYREDYLEPKARLLEVGLREVVSKVGSAALVFVEDTSVRIEALSTEKDEPGIAIKDWFSADNMKELADQIMSKELDPRASVRSDIALHLPGLERPVYFTGVTSGRIASTPPEFERNSRHPWLRPDNFNGWFIPDGTNKRLGEMDFEESIPFDFRVASVSALIDRLEEYTATMNLPPQAYSLRQRRVISGQGQLPLLTPPAFIVIGETCAGKTTFGEHAVSLGQMTHIEASLVMRTIPVPEINSPIADPFARANAVMLRHGFGVVAERILELYSGQLDAPFVITGFRTLQEVSSLIARVPWTRVVLVEASEAARYERYLRRKRAQEDMTLARFREKDSEQGFFGLLSVADYIADVRIRNEGQLTDYLAQAEAVILGLDASSVRGVSVGVDRVTVDGSQMFRTLSAIRLAEGPLSAADIEVLTREQGRAVRRSSVRKVLGDLPGMVRRVGDDERTVRYSLSESGATYLELVERRLN